MNRNKNRALPAACAAAIGGAALMFAAMPAHAIEPIPQPTAAVPAPTPSVVGSGQGEPTGSPYNQGPPSYGVGHIHPSFGTPASDDSVTGFSVADAAMGAAAGAAIAGTAVFLAGTKRRRQVPQPG
jgi:hypothetical protein